LTLAPLACSSDPPPLVAIASHAQGAQLLVNLLTGHAAPDRDKDTLGRTILEQEGALLSSGGAHGARVVGLCRTALVGRGSLEKGGRRLVVGSVTRAARSSRAAYLFLSLFKC